MRAMFCYLTIIAVILFAPAMIAFPIVAVVFTILPRCRALDGKWDYWK